MFLQNIFFGSRSGRVYSYHISSHFLISINLISLSEYAHKYKLLIELSLHWECLRKKDKGSLIRYCSNNFKRTCLPQENKIFRVLITEPNERGNIWRILWWITLEKYQYFSLFLENSNIWSPFLFSKLYESYYDLCYAICKLMVD